MAAIDDFPASVDFPDGRGHRVERHTILLDGCSWHGEQAGERPYRRKAKLPSEGVDLRVVAAVAVVGEAGKTSARIMLGPAGLTMTSVWLKFVV